MKEYRSVISTVYRINTLNIVTDKGFRSSPLSQRKTGCWKINNKPKWQKVVLSSRITSIQNSERRTKFRNTAIKSVNAVA
jgi:hypothetical protein